MDSFLPLIEKAFTEVMMSWGFKAARRVRANNPSYTDAVIYKNDGRTVSVAYAQTREQWCDVTIEGYGTPQPVTDLFDFVRYRSGENISHISTDDPAAFLKEAKRCCNYLVHDCSQFLAGDILAFRRSYRELFVLKFIREARYNAKLQNNWNDFERYHKWLTDYWEGEDYEAAKSAKQRGWRG